MDECNNMDSTGSTQDSKEHVLDVYIKQFMETYTSKRGPLKNFNKIFKKFFNDEKALEMTLYEISTKAKNDAIEEINNSIIENLELRNKIQEANEAIIVTDSECWRPSSNPEENVQAYVGLKEYEYQQNLKEQLAEEKIKTHDLEQKLNAVKTKITTEKARLNEKLNKYFDLNPSSLQ